MASPTQKGYHCEEHSGHCTDIERIKVDIRELREDIKGKVGKWIFVTLVTTLVTVLTVLVGISFTTLEKMSKLDKTVAVMEKISAANSHPKLP